MKKTKWPAHPPLPKPKTIDERTLRVCASTFGIFTTGDFAPAEWDARFNRIYGKDVAFTPEGVYLKSLKWGAIKIGGRPCHFTFGGEEKTRETAVGFCRWDALGWLDPQKIADFQGTINSLLIEGRDDAANKIIQAYAHKNYVFLAGRSRFGVPARTSHCAGRVAAKIAGGKPCTLLRVEEMPMFQL